jgi:hypothetical protein
VTGSTRWLRGRLRGTERPRNSLVIRDFREWSRRREGGAPSENPLNQRRTGSESRAGRRRSNAANWAHSWAKSGSPRIPALGRSRPWPDSLAGPGLAVFANLLCSNKLAIRAADLTADHEPAYIARAAGNRALSKKLVDFEPRQRLSSPSAFSEWRGRDVFIVL